MRKHDIPSIVTNSLLVRIQVDLFISQMDITNENYVSGQTFDNIKRYTDVIQASFSCSGDWLATVEEQTSSDVADVQNRLKFWEFDEQKQRFVAAIDLNVCNNHCALKYKVHIKHSQAQTLWYFEPFL